MKLVHLHNCLTDFATEALVSNILLDHTGFFEYNNPFERKLALDKKHIKANGFMALALPKLMDRTSIWWISRLLDIRISHANWSHFGGVFYYRPGDYLHPHVDAGRHKDQVHVATALLYLTPAELFFWHGEPGYYQRPTVSHIEKVVSAQAGDLVLFTNTDDAWHSIPSGWQWDRAVITVGYMAHDDFKHPDYSNTREHAYFARVEGESTEYDELREARATGSSGAYRTTLSTSAGSTSLET